MRLLFLALLVVLLAASAFCFAADNPVVGSWNCVATSTTGEHIKLTMVVKQEDGKLSGALTMESGDQIAMLEPQLDQNEFRFKININNDLYSVIVKLDGDKLAGKYDGKEASGTVEGTRQS